ncbi:MAG: lipopolysaccharide heptosyltransferase II [Pseudomonadota bacterium]
MKQLLIAPAWIGDMVMAHSLVRLLATADPALELHVVAPAATVDVATRMDEVHRTHTLRVGHGQFGLGPRRRLGRSLRAEHFDRAYVLPNSWKSALVPWLAGVPRRVGWLGESRWGLLTEAPRLDATAREALPLMIARFAALAGYRGEPADIPRPRLAVDADRQQALLREFDLEAGALALCPGAEFGPAKRWPARYYAELARRAQASGRQVWLLGGPNDAAVGAEITRRTPGAAVNLIGATSVLDAIDLLAAAGHVVCNDSGLMHVACAVGVPVTAVYGSTSTGFTPPLGADATAIGLHLAAPSATAISGSDATCATPRCAVDPLPCQPCFARRCRYGHADCLALVDVERVWPTLFAADRTDPKSGSAA